jgi:DNA-binding winged helix-turn-helix (wHTH) protein/tetratricopeptide (TPR) repeat protein
MYELTNDGTRVRSVELAQEPEFHLGKLHVRPALCKVGCAGAYEILQRRVMQVLVVLAQAHDSVVSQRELVARCWGGLSVSDDAIYRCISKLRRLAAGYGQAPFTIEAIPGVGYRLTSAGATHGAADTKTPATAHRRARISALLAIAAALVLVAAGAAFWILQSRAHMPETLRVAVQPFEAMGDSASGPSLARRISNEVVDVLGDNQIETVLVEDQARGVTNPVGTAPGLIVTGILRDDGANAVVDLRLEDGATRAALWSTEFKRDSRKASDLPLEVAARVADAVNIIDFARNADPPLTDDSALTALIQTNDMLRGANDEAWALMLQKARDLVKRHPDFAFGHSLLAAAYAEAAANINVPNQARAMSAAARKEANLTLKLDPQDAGAYAVLSDRLPVYEYSRREAVLLRGIKVAKHPKQPLAALYSYEGLLLGDVGRLREATSFQLVAHAKDEWGPSRTNKLAISYAHIGNLNEARNTLQRAVQFWPDHPGVWKWQQYIAGFYEKPSDAEKVFNSLDARPSLRDSNAIWRTYIAAKVTQGQAAQVASLRIRSAAGDGVISPENAIMMLAGLGQAKQAIDVANSTLDHHVLQPWILFTPITKNLRQDPGFVRLALRMGLIKYWREIGKRPDFCTDPARRNECSPSLLSALE